MYVTGKENNVGRGLEAVYRKRKEDHWAQRVREKAGQDDVGKRDSRRISMGL